jgi:hypothetical protein
MTESFTRLTGMPQAIPNGDTKDIRFTLTTSEGPPLTCVARYGVIAQIAAGLGTALRVLQMALTSENATELVAVENLEDVHIQKDRWSDIVVLLLTTVQGIPYVFQVPSQSASEIADLLKSEATKPTQIGNA